jgi:endonuclease YncB( thermonuclease family)
VAWLRNWQTYLILGALVVGVVVVSRTPRGPEVPVSGPLLQVTIHKDGDSFVGSDGREYRLGLVNAPELNEPCGREAAAFTRRFLADGFRADAYASDAYRRRIAEIFDPSGDSLNVALARSGLSDDKYLEHYGGENPDLARRLEDAFESTTGRASCWPVR